MIKNDDIKHLEKIEIKEIDLNNINNEKFSCKYFKSNNESVKKSGYYFNDENLYFEDHKKSHGDEINWTILQFCVAMNSEKCVTFLLKNGADKNIKDKTNRNCIDIANLLNHKDIIKKIK
jgi:hypothetical protein